MQQDFHYYATYCAAYIAGYSHEESLKLCYADQFTDDCSATLLNKIKAPVSAATTQLQLEMMDMRTDLVGLQNITRIWASFHFLPYDLYAVPRKCSKVYLHKYRLICNTNGDLLVDTVKLAKYTGSIQAAGIAMHILADTWAHRYFAGTPSLAINNTSYDFYEILPEGNTPAERRVTFNHNPASPDNTDTGKYTASIYQINENSIMNLGHGRAGHFPDYCYARYRYLPAWGDYCEIVKDNQEDYYYAFCQMVYAMKYLRGENPDFLKGCYDTEAVAPFEETIRAILAKRQLNACADWKAFGESLSGREIEPFDVKKYQQEYMKAPKEEKDSTYLGRFILAAMAQKSMVTNRVFKSGNLLTGISVDYLKEGFKGISDFIKLVENTAKGGRRNE